MLFLFILIVGALFSFFGPWWVIAPVCFVGCWWLSKRPAHAFWMSALGGATLWVGYSAYLHFTTGSGLTGQLAGIFTGGAPAFAGAAGVAVMLAVAALVAALLSGFSGLAGLRIKQLVRPHSADT